MKTIFHYHGGETRNYGDMAIKYSMQYRINEMANGPIQWIDIDLKDPRPLIPQIIDYINEFGDMLIIGAGGMIMPGDGFETNSGWQFNILDVHLNRLKVPLVVYGIAFNNFPNDEKWEEEKERAIKHLNRTLDLAELKSVRDSLSWLKLARDDVKIIGDPVLLCPVHNETTMYTQKLGPCVGLNWAGDREAQRDIFEGDSEILFQDVVAALQAYLSKQPDANILFIPHVHYDLSSKYLSEFKKIFADKFTILSDIAPWLYPERPDLVPLFASIYGKMDCVLGMRGHACILPLSQNVPTVTLGDHVKNRAVGVDYNTPRIKGGGEINGADFLATIIETTITAPISDNIHYRKIATQNFNREILRILDYA